MSGPRYMLKPWLIRALIPDSVIGAYILWSPSAPVYVGRSDTSLRRRLLEHAFAWPDIYFTFDIVSSSEDACACEWSLLHALGERTLNVDPAQRMGAHSPSTPLSKETVETVRSGHQLLHPTA